MSPPVATQQRPGGNVTTFEPINTVHSGITKHNVQATMGYIIPNEDGSPPAPYTVITTDDYDRPLDAVEVTVHDIKGEVDKYSLDKNGFQIYNFPSAQTDFTDEAKILNEYYPEMERMLKEATGASRVVFFNHTVRRPIPNVEQRVRKPVNLVHVDQSYDSSIQHVYRQLPDEAERLLKTRFQLINCWRPIKPIFKDPLAIADAQSVPESDLVTMTMIYQNREVETVVFLPNKSHKWYYLHGQKPEEVMMIKCYDSKMDGRARRAPHAAFINPEHVDEAPRESIEIRALVFHEDEPAL